MCDSSLLYTIGLIVHETFYREGAKGSGGKIKCYGTNIYEDNLVNSTSDIAFEIAAV